MYDTVPKCPCDFLTSAFPARSSERKPPLMADERSSNGVAQIDESMGLSQTFMPRRQGSDGESARDHALYKNATPGPDNLFHCPWEGQPNCNHKPEKLKCNYE